MISHIYKPKRKNKAGKAVAARLYRGRYRLDGDFAVTDIALGTGDKQVAERKLADIVNEKEREKAGLLAPQKERLAAKKKLRDHLEDYVAELRSLGRTKKHYRLVCYRITRLLEEAGWTYPQDVDADSFGYWRNRQREAAPKTLNEYLNAMLSLLHWMERQGRIQGNPLKFVKKADLRGKQQKRRAFTPEEFARLLAVSGKNRIAYLTAAYTGLRLGEIEQLVWADLHLEAEPPYLLARASTTKNRKEALIPLHPRLAEELKAYRKDGAEEEEAVFSLTIHPERPLYRDMAKAGIEKLDALGRKLDFHSLRYTFATTLAVNGTSQRVAQELMRHSDPMLTAKIYTDVSQLPIADAVNRLPWIADGSCAQIDSQSLGFDGHLGSRTGMSEGACDKLQNIDEEGDSPPKSQSVASCQLVEVAGVEPASLELLRKASTCLSSFLISLDQPRRNRAARTSPPAGEVRPGRNRQPP